MNIAIAGAGIGGLTFALCALQRRWHVTIYEQAKAITEIGAGIQLSPNAMAVFYQLGIANQLKNFASKPQALQMRYGNSGKLIAEIPLNDVSLRRWQYDYLHLHRSDLIDVLFNAVVCHQNAKLITDAKIVRYQNCSDGVEFVTADDKVHKADLLVAADGIHSTLNHQAFGEQLPRFTGNIAWRFTVASNRLQQPPPATAAVWFGNGKHAVSYRIRNGELCNFIGVVETPYWESESWSFKGKKAHIQKDFNGWHPSLVEMIDKADEYYQWAIMDRKIAANWIDGRMVLLGDACHAMKPFMAQGAAMAIEDAWVLAAQLAQHNEYPTALQCYQDLRRPRCVAVQNSANASQALYHQHGYFWGALNRQKYKIGSRLLPAIAMSKMDWLYGFDVTKK